MSEKPEMTMVEVSYLEWVGERVAQLEADSELLKALRGLQSDIEPYALHLEPNVVMYRATPNLPPLANWVERFLTIMRSPRR